MICSLVHPKWFEQYLVQRGPSINIYWIIYYWINKLFRFKGVINELKHKAINFLVFHVLERKLSWLNLTFVGCIFFNYRGSCTFICVLNSSSYTYPTPPQQFLKYLFLGAEVGDLKEQKRVYFVVVIETTYKKHRDEIKEIEQYLGD